MSFRPLFRCDGPQCIRRLEAEDEYDARRLGWLTLRLQETPEDEEAEETTLDFCSFGCLDEWRRGFVTVAEEQETA